MPCTRQRPTGIPRFVPVALAVMICLLATAPGCRREKTGAGQPGAQQGASSAPAAGGTRLGARPPGGSLRAPDPSTALVRQGPRGATSEDGPPTPTPELEGDWVVEQVLVEGKPVPLPKHYQLRLELQAGGTLVVHGLQRTKPSRDEGVWRVREGKLHTRLGRLREVRTFSRQGAQLSLTRGGAFPVTWELKRREPGPAGGGASREGAPREGAPREGAPREGAPREGAPRDGAPREDAPRGPLPE